METVELIQVLEDFNKGQKQIYEILNSIIKRLDKLELETGKLSVDPDGNLIASRN